MPFLTQIKAPSQLFLLVLGRHARTTQCQVQLATEPQHGIANTFCLETAGRPSPYELVVRIQL